MRFDLDRDLLASAAEDLSHCPRAFWLVGGSCTGKTTLSRAIAEDCGASIYDVDAHTFGDYNERVSPERQPCLHAWFTASDPFAWLLDLPEADFLSFNHASAAEFLSLIAEDLRAADPTRTWLVDGGITNPALLAEVAPEAHIACLTLPDGASARIWEEAPERQEMKAMVFAQPEPQAAWRRFLRCDELITTTILEECRAAGIRIWTREEGMSVVRLASEISAKFAL